MTYPIVDTIEFPHRLQEGFAALSGDWNPMHVDSTAARRTAVGKPVVHGMHTVLRTLESMAASSPELPMPVKLEANFLKPIYPGESVDIVSMAIKDKESMLQAVIEGTITTDVRVVYGDSYACQRDLTPSIVDGRRPACRELSLAEIAGSSGTIRLAATPDKIRAHFPNAARWLGIDRVAGLLCLSRLVGMECPGLHSLFSSVSIECLSGDTPQFLEYQVVWVDRRFRLLKMDVNGLGLRGRVEAFVRHPPITQMTVTEVSKLVKRNEFSGQRALIVGGSRGLGELTAKLLAAGGGHPVITYAVGKHDAERVAAEITQWGGLCEILKYDVKARPKEQLESMTAPISHLYYYATCPIFLRKTKCFDSRIMKTFLDFYVRGFYDLYTALQAMGIRDLYAFYPSSIAVEDRPREMTEYAMAKAAGEVLCADLNRFSPGIHVISVRLPRLLTDQTAAFVPTQKANSAELLLPIIRKVQAIQPRQTGHGPSPAGRSSYKRKTLADLHDHDPGSSHE